MKLDHVFIFVDDIPAAENMGATLGLTETYRRKHIGQGTANICYCFENAFLELLVMENEMEARSAPIARACLFQRSRWRTEGTCPIGVAWRLAPGESAPAFEQWAFRPPYLPPGIHIPVATESDDPMRPMLFQSPGVQAPIDWAIERRGVLQKPSGFRRIAGLIIGAPASFTPGSALRRISKTVSIRIFNLNSQRWSLNLVVEDGLGNFENLTILNA